MAEVFSAGGTILGNRTYMKNKDYGYPHGAIDIPDSLIYPYDFGDAEEGTHSSPLFRSDKTGGYTSYTFFADSTKVYTFEGNSGVGTGNVVEGPSGEIIGDDTVKTCTVQITGLGAGYTFNVDLVVVGGDFLLLEDMETILTEDSEGLIVE